MVVASFTMAELSYEQQTQDLRARATVDGLTGLLNRTASWISRRTNCAACAGPGPRHRLILADLDHFKAINDEYGHSAGDTALQAFAGPARPLSVPPTSWAATAARNSSSCSRA